MKKILSLFLVLMPLLAFTQDTIVSPPPPLETDSLSLYDSWINIDIHTDDWPEETTWELVDSNDVAIASGGPYNSEQTLYSEIVNLNSGEYYYFLFDSYGDGLWTGGYVEITNTCDTVLFFHEGPFTDYTIDEVIEGFQNGEPVDYQANELTETLTITPCAAPLNGCTPKSSNACIIANCNNSFSLARLNLGSLGKVLSNSLTLVSICLSVTFLPFKFVGSLFEEKLLNL